MHTLYWFMNSHLVENRENHFSHIPLQPECRPGSLFSPTRPGHRSGWGSPADTQLVVSTVERGAQFWPFLCKVLGPSSEPRLCGFSARTVPPCGLALFLAPQHVSLTLGPSQKFCETPNSHPLMHPFLLKVATGISVVCSQKPCWAE